MRLQKCHKLISLVFRSHRVFQLKSNNNNQVLMLVVVMPEIRLYWNEFSLVAPSVSRPYRNSIVNYIFQIRCIDWRDSGWSIFRFQLWRRSVWHRGRSSIENPSDICPKHLQVSFEWDSRNNCERIHRLGTPNTASNQYSVSTSAAAAATVLH